MQPYLHMKAQSCRPIRNFGDRKLHAKYVIGCALLAPRDADDAAPIIDSLHRLDMVEGSVLQAGC